MELKILPYPLSVVRLEPSTPLPEWVFESEFFSLTRTDDELSIFCESRVVPQETPAVRGWRCFRVVGQIDLELTGILSSLAMPLATRQISIFSISTHDTDYMVLQEKCLNDAVDVLVRAGHVFV